jgi:hypothetical protein
MKLIPRRASKITGAAALLGSFLLIPACKKEARNDPEPKPSVEEGRSTPGVSAGSDQVKGAKSPNPSSGGANNGHVGSAANSGNPDATKKP